MTIALPDGWQARFEEPAEVLHLMAPGGRQVATVEVPLPSAPGVGGLLDRAVERLEREVRSGRRGYFVRERGRLDEDGGIAVLHTAYAPRPGTIRNDEGYRRFRRGEIMLGGRTYALEHRSRWRTEVLRDGAVLATLRRRPLSLRWRRLDRIAQPTIHRAHPLDPVDGLVVVVAATVCGPPGRVGVLGRCLSDVSSFSY